MDAHLGGQVAAEQRTAVDSQRTAALTRTLTAFYTAHGPENLGNVAVLVARVVGGAPSLVGGNMVGGILWTEEELFSKIEAKYGVKVERAA
mmetsp:Transcript_45087/g.75228  ORF Transcript_45087/g.75228 Transcript_45087/m.75228 type:complete len:91 (+) Transcript_45087:131-403(+)